MTTVATKKHATVQKHPKGMSKHWFPGRWGTTDGFSFFKKNPAHGYHQAIWSYLGSFPDVHYNLHTNSIPLRLGLGTCHTGGGVIGVRGRSVAENQPAESDLLYPRLA